MWFWEKWRIIKESTIKGISFPKRGSQEIEWFLVDTIINWRYRRRFLGRKLSWYKGVVSLVSFCCYVKTIGSLLAAYSQRNSINQKIGMGCSMDLYFCYLHSISYLAVTSQIHVSKSWFSIISFSYPAESHVAVTVWHLHVLSKKLDVSFHVSYRWSWD